MKICCIEGCESRSTNTDRSFFEYRIVFEKIKNSMHNQNVEPVVFFSFEQIYLCKLTVIPIFIVLQEVIFLFKTS